MPSQHRSARARARETLDAREDEVRRLHGEGLSQTEAARRIGVTQPDLSRWSRSHGLAWGPPPTEATEAQAARLQRARWTVAEAALADVAHLRERLWYPTTEYVVTREGIEKITTAIPTPRATADLATAIEKLMRVAIHASGGIEDVSVTENRRDMLWRLGIQIRQHVHSEGDS